MNTTEKEMLRTQLRQALVEAAQDLQGMLKSPVHFSHLRPSTTTREQDQMRHREHLEIRGRTAGALLDVLRTDDDGVNELLSREIFSELAEVVEQHLQECLTQEAQPNVADWTCRLSVPQRALQADLTLHVFSPHEQRAS